MSWARCFDSVETGLLNACLKVGRWATALAASLAAVSLMMKSALTAQQQRQQLLGEPRRRTAPRDFGQTRHSAETQRMLWDDQVQGQIILGHIFWTWSIHSTFNHLSAVPLFLPNSPHHQESRREERPSFLPSSLPLPPPGPSLFSKFCLRAR